jgi:hypothetical protein
MSTIVMNPNGSLERIANAPPITRPRVNFEIELPKLASTHDFEMKQRKQHGLFVNSFFILFIVLIMGMGWIHPWHTWDLLGYIGSSMSIENNDITTIHQRTYAVAAKYLPQKEFEEQTTAATDWIGAAYRIDMAKDAGHFAEQFPYFKVKPLYLFTLYGLMKAGIDPVHADVLISCLSCGLICLILRKWLRMYLQSGIAEMATAALLLLGGILDIAGITTPDTLSALAVVAAFYTIAMKKTEWLTIAALFAAMLVRADNAPLIFIYLFYAKFIAEKKISWEKAMGVGVTGICAFLGVKEWAGFYGWHVHFYHSFIQRVIDPEHFNGSVSIAQYISTIVFALRMKPPCNINWFFIAIASSGILLARPNSLRRNILFHLVCMAGVASVFHFFIFPEPVPRFFFAYYIIAGVFFIEQVRRVKALAWRRKNIKLEYLSPAL